jgi:hypothetical protein
MGTFIYWKQGLSRQRRQDKSRLRVENRVKQQLRQHKPLRLREEKFEDDGRVTKQVPVVLVIPLPATVNWLEPVLPEQFRM